MSGRSKADQSFEESSSDFDESGEDDDELTLDEEEALDKTGDSTDELDMLREEGELSVEELRRRYDFYGTASTIINSDMPGTSAAAVSAVFEQPRSSSRTQLLAQLLEEPDDSVDDNDDDYEPTEQFSRKICVGENYQIGELSAKVSNDESSHAADPLWAPSEKCDDSTIQSYLKECERLRYVSQDNSGQKHRKNAYIPPSRSAPPKASTSAVNPSDDENALYALYTKNYDVKRAVAKAPFGWASMCSVNGPRRTYTEPWRHFTEEDCVLFEEGIRQYKKNFFLIQREKLNDRTVGELVRFYYTWKKTERHDIFMREKPYELGIDRNSTDYMGEIVNEMYNEDVPINDEDEMNEEDGDENDREEEDGEDEKEDGEDEKEDGEEEDSDEDEEEEGEGEDENDQLDEDGEDEEVEDEDTDMIDSR